MNNPLPSNLVPDRWLADTFIAGGYAAMPERASDIDVWVTVPVENNLGAVRGELLDHLREEGFVFDTQDEARTRNIDVWVDAYTNLQTMKVALVKGLSPKTDASTGYYFHQPIHLIVTNGTVDDVLDSFDLSTHQIALVQEKGDWVPVKGLNYTPVTQVPTFLKFTPTTDERFDKLMKRYADFNGITRETTNGF